MGGGIKKKKMSILHTLVPSRIERVLKEAPWSFTTKKNPLKEACREFLDRLKVTEGAAAAAAATAGGDRTQDLKDDDDEEQLVHKAVDALQLACGTSSPKICEPALDALHKLVAAGLLKAHTATWCVPRDDCNARVYARALPLACVCTRTTTITTTMMVTVR